jgi:fatty-acyl-CoA synthase
MEAPIDYEHLPMHWVGDWSGQRCRQTPTRTALIEPQTGQSVSFAELDTMAQQWAGWMQDQAGLNPLDVVAVIAQNRIEAIVLYLACGKLGVVLAPVSHRLTPAEANDLIARINPKWVFFDTALTAFTAALDDSARQRRWLSFGGDDSDYAKSVATREPYPINRPLALSQISLLVHTGGSTGLPKICQVSYRQMLWNAFELMTAATEGLGQRRELLLFPLFHIGGWNTLLPVLHAGGCVVLLPTFNPHIALDTIQRYAINHLGAVEAMLKAIADLPEFKTTDLSSLQGITTAGAACRTATMEIFLDRGIPISQAYGLTEAGPSNFYYSRTDQSLATLRAHSQRIGSVFAHSDYRIVRPEDGHLVSQGEVGELQCRSLHNFSGYLDDPQRTQAMIDAQGWISTGDLAREDATGQVVLTGRVDNMLVSGGENIAAEALEALIETHPAIDQALVFGLPDARWGTRPAAWVVGTDALSISALDTWAKHELPAFKRPVAWRLVEALPLTGAGKWDRRAARAQHMRNTQGENQ